MVNSSSANTVCFSYRFSWSSWGGAQQGNRGQTAGRSRDRRRGSGRGSETRSRGRGQGPAEVTVGGPGGGSLQPPTPRRPDQAPWAADCAAPVFPRDWGSLGFSPWRCPTGTTHLQVEEPRPPSDRQWAVCVRRQRPCEPPGAPSLKKRVPFFWETSSELLEVLPAEPCSPPPSPALAPPPSPLLSLSRLLSSPHHPKKRCCSSPGEKLSLRPESHRQTPERFAHWHRLQARAGLGAPSRAEDAHLTRLQPPTREDEQPPCV